MRVNNNKCGKPEQSESSEIVMQLLMSEGRMEEEEQRVEGGEMDGEQRREEAVSD